jgi:hypothetical protein
MRRDEQMEDPARGQGLLARILQLKDLLGPPRIALNWQSVIEVDNLFCVAGHLMQRIGGPYTMWGSHMTLLLSAQLAYLIAHGPYREYEDASRDAFSFRN